MYNLEDKTRPYEDLRGYLGNMTLKEIRLSMAKSTGLVGEDFILTKLNGFSSNTLKKYLEETLYREIYRPR